MIRDPSDGSVREDPVAGNPTTQPMTGIIPAMMASGLPTASGKPENIARLEKSRQWLKEYHNAKQGEKAE